MEIVKCPKCHQDTEINIANAADEEGEVFTCEHCGYYEGIHSYAYGYGNGYDYCNYYEQYLPPMDIDYCLHATEVKNQTEGDLLRYFKRKSIDDVIEDYLNGRDFSEVDI